MQRNAEPVEGAMLDNTRGQKSKKMEAKRLNARTQRRLHEFHELTRIRRQRFLTQRTQSNAEERRAGWGNTGQHKGAEVKKMEAKRFNARTQRRLHEFHELTRIRRQRFLTQRTQSNAEDAEPVEGAMLDN